MNIYDWDHAYNNRLAVENSERWIASWRTQGAAYQIAQQSHAEFGINYGADAREVLDVYLPEGFAKGTLVFVHGGYWQSCSKDDHAQFAEGARARGWRVVIVDYPLCPQVSVRQIAQSVCHAIEFIALRYLDGPIVLAGHSAGGHLVTFAVSRLSHLSTQCRARIQRVLSVSGLHDLRPITFTKGLNTALELEEIEAEKLSPALSAPGHTFQLICVCGSEELPEFRRQNALLASLWLGLGGSTECFEIPGRHHFSVVDDLKTPGSHLSRLATLSEYVVD
ncbi:alpha/beta hydrolase [Pseudomonas edaphica]|uniref:Alpha/beta hydrolase n=1 Tax=Pseudomonas edaphica TaxID=2006980 RepID=A0ABY2U4W6_9PSED|nr:alpha/beta hydrolase [Pseudomonas edaphica]TLG91250.1 alpha/beta hydrolase [Pseudomonas edaphica]